MLGEEGDVDGDSEDGQRRWQLRTVPTDLARAVPGRGLVGPTARLGDDGRRRPRPTGRRRRSTCARRSGRGRAPSPTSTGPPGRSPARCAPRGVGPGDVVVLQLPNWVEAGIAFWAAAYLGAVVVPVVHFYGAKEVDYILGATDPTSSSPPTASATPTTWPSYDGAAGRPARCRAGWSWATPRPARSRRGATAVRRRCSTATRSPAPRRSTPTPRRSSASPRARPATPRASSTRTARSAARPASSTTCSPTAARRRSPARRSGHFIGMLNAFLVPLLRDRPVNLVDVWDPGEVLRLMLDEGLGVGGGATYFLTSLLDHPDFTDEHLALMPFAGLGGSTVPGRRHRAGRPSSASRRSAPTGAPSTRRSPAACSTTPRTSGSPPTATRCPASRCGSTSDGEISSRGPDCFVGYTDPELTAAVFDADGWYRTGDVGVLDDDGYLTITDRMSDIIIRGGENISAQEVEELLLGPRRRRRGQRGRRPRRAARASAPPRSSACARARRRRRSTTSAPTSPRPAWPARSGPSRSTRWRTSPARRRARSRSSGCARACGERLTPLETTFSLDC